jgi:hypothetical protein
MSYDEVAYSDDQIGVSMISDYDREPMPGLYDTTRADIFKMVSSPCFKCDGQFKGMPQQMQFGPPFRPPCESSMSYNYGVNSQVRALYPEANTQCMSCGGKPPSQVPTVTVGAPLNKQGRTPVEQSAMAAQSKNLPTEHYQTFGPCACAARQYISAGPQGYGCSCLGLIGCRRLPEARQSGVQPEAFANPQINPPLNMLFFVFLIIIFTYLGYIHSKICGMTNQLNLQPITRPANQ